jgi:hypothetical protein
MINLHPYGPPPSALYAAHRLANWRQITGTAEPMAPAQPTSQAVQSQRPQRAVIQRTPKAMTPTPKPAQAPTAQRMREASEDQRRAAARSPEPAPDRHVSWRRAFERLGWRF